MNNRQKKHYLNLKVAYQSTPLPSELEKLNDLVALTPSSLYKYRKFDEHTFEMIENDYVFLTPVGWLDDPFECMTSVDMSTIFKADKVTLTPEMMEFIVDQVLRHPHANSINKKDLIALIDKSTVNGAIDPNILATLLEDYEGLTQNEKQTFLGIFPLISQAMSNLTEEKALNDLFKAFIDSKNQVGICSFTTKRDNKPMWSLYGDRYKGYCLEYDIGNEKKVLANLFPVIYTSKREVNLVKTLFKFVIETMIRFASFGNMPTEMGCFNEILCNKDKAWSYQDEWRLIGAAKGKGFSYRIKNVYLGFDVSKENEELMLESSQKKGFSVYKMNDPINNNRISYTKIWPK